MKTPEHLVNEHYQDRYFDVVNAIAEARHVYFEGCKILEQLKQHGTLFIGETGFGAGRVLLSLLHFLQTASAPDNTAWQIEFASVELHPLPAERLAEILSMFRNTEPGIDPWIDRVIEAYAQFDLDAFHQWQQQSISAPFGEVTLKLWLGEALEMVNAVTDRDAWFLEGHGPKSNPHIWRTELLKTVGKRTRTGGYCATFTVAGDIRRDLRAAGFNTRRLKGFGGKKEVLQGVKRAPQKSQTSLQVVDYQPAWATQFNALKGWLQNQLTDIVGIEHVGSTSIEGMAAKPILDIDIILSSPLHRTQAIKQLSILGYLLEGNLGVTRREALRYETLSYPKTVPPHHLYLCTIDSPALHQHLLLRDYLRTSPERAKAYGDLKIALVKRFPEDRSAYNGAKTRFINQLLAEAKTVKP